MLGRLQIAARERRSTSTFLCSLLETLGRLRMGVFLAGCLSCRLEKMKVLGRSYQEVLPRPCRLENAKVPSCSYLTYQRCHRTLAGDSRCRSERICRIS